MVVLWRLSITKDMVRYTHALRLHSQAENFSRAMPDEFKYDDSIDTFTAYKMYIASKPWVKDNYLRKPERKPDWI